LFQYFDEEGQAQSIESGDVNDYIRTIAGGDFTAKDFRTWGGTCLAVSFLLTKCSDVKNKQIKAALVDVVKDVASKLGNKPATCKKYYIHPTVLECYASGRLLKAAKTFRHNHHGYDYEKLVLSLLPQLNKRRAA
jgi:DNA topoisomerase-1